MVKFIYLKYQIRCQVILYLLINISPFKSFGYDFTFFIQQGFIKLIKSDNTDISYIKKSFLYRINSLILNLLFIREPYL